MTPREYFDQVAQPNTRDAAARPGDLRSAINAIMTLDCFFGILHDVLYRAGFIQEQSDDRWKEKLARENDDYRLLRDTASC